MNKKLNGLLGMCRKAGKCACGASAVLYAIKGGRCKFVFIASDSGENTKNKFTRLCGENGIAYTGEYDRYELGAAVGRTEKAVVGITDENFAKGIIRAAGSNSNDMEVSENDKNQDKRDGKEIRNGRKGTCSVT